MALDFLHPSIWFFALVLLLLVWRGQSWRYILPISGILAIVSVILMKGGTYSQFNYLGEYLTMGRVDSLSILFAHVFAIQALIGFIYAWHVKDKGKHIAAALYVAGGFGCVFAGDYITLFIFWELMSVASTFVVWLARNPTSVQAGFRYFLFHTLGGLFLLAGILLRYKATGSFEFTSISPEQAQYYDYLILIGFCVNAAVVPLHAWLPDSYPEATITGAVFMSAFTTKTAVYVLIRAFAGFEILAVMGTIMALYGVFYATVENNARRILSYHIVSQVGYMVAGCGIGTALTLNGSSAHAYAHIIYKGLLFMSTGCLLYAVGTAKLSQLGGLIGKLPYVFIAYMIAAVSISGMPLFSGFVSKTMVINGAAIDHRMWITLGLELASVGTFLSVGLKLPYFAFYGNKNIDTSNLKPIPSNMYLAMAIAAFLCFIIGVYPKVLYNLLPFEAEYVPYTPWSVLQSLQLLAFTGLGFFWMVKKLTPEAKINLDFEYFYRHTGRIFVGICRNPVAFFDSIWNDVYRKLGMAGMKLFAGLTARFDVSVIKGIVDGLALTIRRIGNNTAKVQSGFLSDYLLAAILFSFGLVALVVMIMNWNL